MGKALSLVAVRQYGATVQFYNCLDGRQLVEILLSPQANYTENTEYVFKVADAVEDYLEEMVDRSIPVNTAHRPLVDVTVVPLTPSGKAVLAVKDKRQLVRFVEYADPYNKMNNLSFQNKLAVACENYIRAITKRRNAQKLKQFQIGRNPEQKDFGALGAR